MKTFLTIIASVLLGACSTTKTVSSKPQTTDPALLAKWFNGEDVSGIESDIYVVNSSSN